MMRTTKINRVARLLAESWIARDAAYALMANMDLAEECEAHTRARELHAQSQQKSHGKNLLVKHTDGE